MFRDYHAVSVRHGTNCCQAVEVLSNRRFLSVEAPQLPVEGCTLKGRCRCRYQHHTDRRDDLRRDADFGLPDRGILRDENRRNQPGRRNTDYA